MLPPRPAVLLAALLLAPVAAAEDALLALGQRVFNEQAHPPCALCHSLAAAGARGTLGPDLDQLRPDAARVEAAVRNGLGVMPAFAGILSEEQIRAVAAYVAGATSP